MKVRGRPASQHLRAAPDELLKSGEVQELVGRNCLLIQSLTRDLVFLQVLAGRFRAERSIRLLVQHGNIRERVDETAVERVLHYLPREDMVPFWPEALVDLVILLVKADPDPLLDPISAFAVIHRQVQNQPEKLV